MQSRESGQNKETKKMKEEIIFFLNCREKTSMIFSPCMYIKWGECKLLFIQLRAAHENVHYKSDDVGRRWWKTTSQ